MLPREGPQMASGVIDIHAHFVPNELVAEAKRNGQAYGVEIEDVGDGRERLRFRNGPALRPFFPELCDLSIRMPALKRQGVARQLLSTWTDMAGDLLPPQEGARWARLQNETLSNAARTAPHMFEAMGTLPLQNVDLAIKELEHIVATLGIRSIEVGTNVNGRDLDSPEFRPLWRRICDLDVFVMLHPPLFSVGGERVSDYFLNNLIGYLADTTIAAARLIFSGIFSELPKLKCCLVHGGGFLPYQIGRLDRGYDVHPACKGAFDRKPSSVLSCFYFDTLTHNDAALSFLTTMVDSGRILYGSDYPFEMVDEAGPSRIQRLPMLSLAAKQAILGENAAHALGYSPTVYNSWQPGQYGAERHVR
jgi:aminocarboxymuconate-semialdehyde decarboxylase